MNIENQTNPELEKQQVDSKIANPIINFTINSNNSEEKHRLLESRKLVTNTSKQFKINQRTSLETQSIKSIRNDFQQTNKLPLSNNSFVASLNHNSPNIYQKPNNKQNQSLNTPY